MARLGYSEQEISEVSDRLVDAIVGHGDERRSRPRCVSTWSPARTT